MSLSLSLSLSLNIGKIPDVANIGSIAKGWAYVELVISL